MSENCCRCQQQLGSPTDNSVLFDTDYYQQDEAQQIWRSKIYRDMNVALSLVLFIVYVIRCLSTCEESSQMIAAANCAESGNESPENILC